MAEEKTLERIRGADFVRFYANNFQVAFTAWDVRITFAELVERPEGSTVLEERATVVMSLQHAKATIAILAKNFNDLEKEFGEIKFLEHHEG